jgi:hypothetical protein
MTITTQLTVLPEGEPIYSPKATVITIEDEAAGEYVKIEQRPDDREAGAIYINPDEWPELRDAINQMIEACRP